MDYNDVTFEVHNEKPEFPLPPAITTTEIPDIDAHTIECDLRAFVRWLNALKDQVNYLTHIYADLRYIVEDNFYRIWSLEVRMDAAEANIFNLQQRMTKAEGDIWNIQQDLIEIHGAIDNTDARVDLLYSWLPVPYGLIDPYGWKFAMGNISAMSGNNGVPLAPGPGIGIYTRGYIGENDIYFN